MVIFKYASNGMAVWDISFQIQIVICHLQLIHIFILQKKEGFNYPAGAGWVQH